MYSPTTRVLTILEMLQSHRQLSGTEIARRLEVDKRTVRRYIVMLQDMGIPVEAERGEYGGYQLQRGFKLPPLMYTDAEAVAITLGLIAIREFRFPIDIAAVEGALAKTERVMPEKLLRQARALQEAIVFNVVPPPALRYNDAVMILSSAVQERRRVWMRYEAFSGDHTERDFDPYGIVFNEGYWYTTGYCHLRDDMRTFRMDRIVDVAIVSGTFERPPEFDVMETVLNAVASPTDANGIVVRLRTTMEKARAIFPPIMGTLEQTDDGIIFRRSATQLEWVAHIMLTTDFPVEIIEGDALRDMIRHIGARAHEILEEIGGEE